jgi:hypothetical protein
MTSSPTTLANPEVKNCPEEVLGSLAPRYVWWLLEGSNEDRTDRTLAQIMNLGTYQDIRAIEAVFSNKELIAVMARAQPGWFSDRSWEFWRGRLSTSADDAIPAKPPRRSFDAEMLRARI